MDGILVVCGLCGLRLRARAEFAGRTMHCPKCGAAVQVPEEEDTQPGASAGSGAVPQEPLPTAALLAGDEERGAAVVDDAPAAARGREPVLKGLNRAQMVVVRALGKLHTALIALWLLAVLVLLFTMQVRLGRIERGMSSMTPDLAKIERDLQLMRADLSNVDRNVSSIETDVSSIETDVSHIKRNVSSIETDVSSIETDVSHIKIWGVQIEK